MSLDGRLLHGQDPRYKAPAISMGDHMAAERTLSIIKPDATRRNLTGRINAMIEDAGLRIIAQKRVLWSKADAETFYAVHRERPFYRDLVTFMSSGPIVLQVLEGEDAVAEYRKVMGATVSRPRLSPRPYGANSPSRSRPIRSMDRTAPPTPRPRSVCASPPPRSPADRWCDRSCSVCPGGPFPISPASSW